MADGRPFTIVLFTDSFFETNGVGTYCRTLLSWAQRSAHGRVMVVCPARRHSVHHRFGADVVAIRPRWAYHNPFYPDLLLGWYAHADMTHLLERTDTPVVIHVATAGPLGVAGARLARRLKLPCVGCYHTNLQEYCRVYGRSLLGRLGEATGEWFGRWCDRRAYAHCDAMVVPSESAARTVGNVFHGPIHVIPNPLDLRRFSPAPDRNGAFRDQYNPHDKTLVVAVGRLAKEKNLDLICEHLLPDPRIELVFVGDGPYTPELRRKWGATVTGFLHGDDLLAAYQQADVFVQLSLTETFGLSLVEALACGLPAVVLRSGGFVETIPPGSGVIVIEPGELPQLGDRCVELTADPADHAEYGRRVRAFVDQLSAERVLPTFMGVHEELLRR